MKKPKPINLEQMAQAGCGDLLEVTLFAPQGANEHDFLLGADVRFGTMIVSSEDWSKSVEIGLARATLGLDLTGCEIDPSAHRFGDKKPVVAKTHIQRTQADTKAFRIGGSGSLGAQLKGGNLSLGKNEATLSAGASKEGKVSATETQVADTREEPVVAMSGNRWRFSAVAEAYMQSRYSGDETLCKLRVNAPNIRVEGRLAFQPKDIVMIDVEAQPALLDRFKKSPNQTAIAKVLLARHLKEINLLEDKSGATSIAGWCSTLQGVVKNDE
ncbi:hypothetical protein [Bradyrhizobium sp. URHD0069]|uniref:hypothetical protein n=1 Tax=Bradyrhizobium sp. URHD0069 TaxID=1380355 RepID=UPI0012DDFD54|nr:hypothetical protein [Bradyrhizobium sp. URHD0069]